MKITYKDYVLDGSVDEVVEAVKKLGKEVKVKTELGIRLCRYCKTDISWRRSHAKICQNKDCYLKYMRDIRRKANHKKYQNKEYLEAIKRYQALWFQYKKGKITEKPIFPKVKDYRNPFTLEPLV